MSAPMREQVNTWQPIKTAPRDTKVIVSGFNFDDPKQGRWVDSAILTETGWAWNIEFSDAGPYPPTHWMPLPAPPTDELFPQERAT